MHLAALSAGGQAPRGRFNGTVHSVFRQACNIRLDDGRMLALLAPHLGNVPHGVRVDLPAGFAFADHLAVGRPVGCRADLLRVASGPAVDLGSARPWAGELPPAGIDLELPTIAQAWRAAWDTLRRSPFGADGTELNVIAGAVHAEGLRLARAARHFRTDEATRALDCLVGCGPGLTPSGDDLIIGFLAGLWSAAGGHAGRRAFLDALCAAVAAAAAATGDISCAYLAHAVHGRFAEPLTVLAWQIGAGAARVDVEVATLAALRVGHTSGSDGVFGLLLGLSAWTARATAPGDLELQADG